MNLYKNSILFLSFLLFFNLVSSQEIKKDSIKTNDLDEVVVTAQYSKQSVKKSVFDVIVINSKTIEQNAANNLADLLNQNLNIHIVPNTKEGKSQVSLFGLDGQYFKILQDGIPLVSEDGFGNNIDLTQINLDNVKQIEIVEGSMGVTYGANAVSGIINIITKTSARNKWEISAAIQEETVGDEYEWWNKGRHIQNFKLAHNINDNLYASANFSRNQFTGFFGERKGKNHFVNDGLRGHEWLPKEQITTKGILHYSKEDYKIIYKIGFFKEFLNRYESHVTEQVYNPETEFFDILAEDDEDFLTNRMTHDFVISGQLNKKINYNVSAAYQEQTKKFRRVIYDLHTRKSDRGEYLKYLARKTYFSKITLNNFTTNKPYDFEVGLEYNLEDGFFSAVASSINTVDADEKLSNLDGFISAEYEVNDKLLFRPGLRYSIQSKFKNQLAYSLSTRYLLNNGFELRNVIGSSYRTPNFDELFTYFVDANHNVTGNENLIPERSFSIFTYLKKTSYLKNGIKLKNKLKIGFINVDDRIDLAVVETTPQLAYKYINIDKFKSINFSTENSLKYKNLNLQLGATLAGVSQVYSSEIEEKDDYLYTFQLNSSIAYFFKKINTTFTINYKYNGKQYRFVQDIDANLIKEKLEDYSWSDTSLKKSFLDNKIETTIGVRNLFNVKALSSSSTSVDGIHATNDNGSLLGYGTSYFLKLKYNLNI